MVRALESSTAAAGAAEQQADNIHFYASSGGNAGLACVTAANALGRPATIVVPLTTTPRMVARLRGLGAADVVQVGANWAAADAHLRGVVMPAYEARGGPRARAVYVPPFDHRDVWDGAATMVDELGAQMAAAAAATTTATGGGARSSSIDGIVCSVGGGGLLCGIMQGVQRLKEEAGECGGGDGPKVLAVETRGGDSLNASVRAGELVTLPAITTIATSLGATRVAEEAFAWTRRAGGGALVSAVVTDGEAVSAMSRFLDDERMLVESACGATIATAYNGDLRRYLGDGLTDEQWAGRNIVLIVCGGSNINLEMLQKYKADFGI